MTRTRIGKHLGDLSKTNDIIALLAAVTQSALTTKKIDIKLFFKNILQ